MKSRGRISGSKEFLEGFQESSEGEILGETVEKFSKELWEILWRNTVEFLSNSCRNYGGNPKEFPVQLQFLKGLHKNSLRNFENILGGPLKKFEGPKGKRNSEGFTGGAAEYFLEKLQRTS